MKRTRLVGLAFLAMLAVSVATAASASATCSPLPLGYCVNGARLLTGSTKEITASAKNTFTMRVTFFGAVNFVLTCTDIALSSAEKPMIIGGMPGKGTKQQLLWGSCSATLGGIACNGVSVSFASTATVQVMILLPETLKGQLATLFRPSSGTEFVSVKLKECGIFGSPEAKVEGTLAALDSPSKAEGTHGGWVWNETQEITEVVEGSQQLAVGLKFSGKPTTLNGEALLLLVSKEAWGVF